MIYAILRRFGQMLFVMFGISVIVFLIFFATPGADPAARIAGRNATPEVLEAVRHNFGFDRPLYVQYVKMMEKIFVTGDLTSFVNRGWKVVPAVMILSVRDLKISFRTNDGLVRAIDGVSFDLEESEILGVVGESGSGKTVSLLAVMGLITDPNASIEGSIRYKGRELVGLPARELKRLRGNEIAMIFQDPMTALTPVYTIGWQIAEQIRAHQNISKAKAMVRVEELLAEVNFPNPHEAMSRYPHQLSGGMRSTMFR